ncbi:MAG: Gfo/Idh/MocA family oxidoreductase [Lentisphaerae bacterium]|jgi:predicted dehydrogenase|nr:Gfo/Idh/MocA family oxidoreductase [Lentisphaerota bacterium]
MIATKTLNTVILGCGAISNFHLASLQRLSNRFRLVGVADLNLQKAQKAAAPFEAEASSDGIAMLQRLQPDVTLVALPHLLHLEYGLAALENGSHLLLEKPMAVSSEACRKLLEKAEAYDRKILVGHTHRFRPHFRRAAQMIREGMLGKVEMIFDDAASFYDFDHRPRWFMDPVMAGGGALFNLVPHLLDHLLFLNDSPVAEVSAKLANLYPGLEIDTECTAMLRFTNGVLATINASVGNRLIEPGRLQCRVFGRSASLLMNAFTPEIIYCHGNQRETIDCSGQVDPIDLEWLELYEGIIADKPIHADGAYGYRIVRLQEAIRKSSELSQWICTEEESYAYHQSCRDCH